MIKKLLLIMILGISFTSADGQRDFYEDEDETENEKDYYEDRNFCELQNENQVLKLKLEVHNLKEQIFELEQTLKEINGGEKELQRVKAIKELKRELRRGREISLEVN